MEHPRPLRPPQVSLLSAILWDSCRSPPSMRAPAWAIPTMAMGRTVSQQVGAQCVTRASTPPVEALRPLHRDFTLSMGHFLCREDRQSVGLALPSIFPPAPLSTLATDRSSTSPRLPAERTTEFCFIRIALTRTLPRFRAEPRRPCKGFSTFLMQT